MHNFRFAAAIMVASGLFLVGCERSVEQRLQDKKTELKFLTQKELNLATANAKVFFEKDWKYVESSGKEGSRQGVFQSCEISDSNTNWKVSVKSHELGPTPIPRTWTHPECGKYTSNVLNAHFFK